MQFLRNCHNLSIISARGGLCQVGIDKRWESLFNWYMRVILGLIVLLGVVSALSFKLFLEPAFFKKAAEAPVLEDTVTSESSGESATGTTPTTNPSAASFAGPVANQPTLTITTRADRKAINLTFESLSTATIIDYTVTYVSKNINRGITGKIIRSKAEQTLTREILLGTCSKDVCTYDEGVTTVKIAVVYTFENATTTKVDKVYVLE